MADERLILLVEDNDDDVQLTLRALKLNHVANRVDVARDGAEALDYLFCRGAYARREPRTKRLPVVILTSSNVESDLARSYDLGANSYIRKPVDFTRFMDTVNSLGLYWLVFNEKPPAAGS